MISKEELIKRMNAREASYPANVRQVHTDSRKVASELNRIIHNRNLFLVSTGERHIDARVKNGKVVTVGLYSGQEIEYAPAIFRDGYGNQVNV